MNERTRHYDVFSRTCALTGEDCTYMGDNGSTDCRRCVVPIVVENRCISGTSEVSE